MSQNEGQVAANPIPKPQLNPRHIEVRSVRQGSIATARSPGSAAERFLFKFLDGLPQTKGLFALNGRLDIPFGPNPFMEVDLLCTERKLAVEIDGAFHFEDAEHYRRDRRKDNLLQKNGYLVMRFLAADVTHRLPHVLDDIHAALSTRSSAAN